MKSVLANTIATYSMRSPRLFCGLWFFCAGLLAAGLIVGLSALGEGGSDDAFAKLRIVLYASASAGVWGFLFGSWLAGPGEPLPLGYFIGFGIAISVIAVPTLLLAMIPEVALTPEPFYTHAPPPSRPNFMDGLAALVLFSWMGIAMFGWLLIPIDALAGAYLHGFCKNRETWMTSPANTAA
jgi:hypothetical protein